MTIAYHRNFTKGFKKLPIKHQDKFKQRLRLFKEDSFSPTLNNHELIGNYKGYRSINVTGDLRAVFKIEEDDNILFVKIDSHSNLYKK
ncbi:MAG TPA: type II toxin-antitoxin system mRNA interferase toxin, RelE/StbE family [Patescibacteria group bacterium]